MGSRCCLKRQGKNPFQSLFAAEDSWESVDHELFEELRELRRKLARERRVPAYIIFGDVTLRDMARQHPCTSEALLRVSGIGMKKLEQYGERILNVTQKHATRRQQK